MVFKQLQFEDFPQAFVH